jgi:predicted GIY-YIG superfamily endonuclease
MGFWAYLLHCRDRTFYAGHAEDLEQRITQHQDGSFGGYTLRKRPVTLVWCGQFPTREEAQAFERRIKGWSRAKKLALIRGDWNEISRLAKGKWWPSTSSGRPVEGYTYQPDRPELVEGRSFFLQRHPTTPSDVVQSIEARLSRQAAGLHLSFLLGGDTQMLVLPAASTGERQDELWRSTCFEAFIRRPGGGYTELNFAPSSDWAAYVFHDYRAGMADLPITAPEIRMRLKRRGLRLDVAVELQSTQTCLNLAAVIEEKSGRKSYWALAHPPSGPPDFHHPDCFVLELPPPGAA